MRSLLVLALLATAACTEMTGETKAVDPASLKPLSGKELALLAAGDGAVARNDFPNAEQNYQSAIAASTGQVEAHMALARLYADRQMTGKARDVLRRGLELQPNHPGLNHQLGKLHLADHSPQAALDAFERGLVRAPNDTGLLNGAGIASDMLRRHSQAQAFYRRALNPPPPMDADMLRTNLGMSYLLSGEPKQAEEVLKQAMKSPNPSPVTRHNLALAYGMLGKNAEARKLVANDMTETDRKLALERLQQYLAKRDSVTNPPPMPQAKHIVHPAPAFSAGAN